MLTMLLFTFGKVIRKISFGIFWINCFYFGNNLRAKIKMRKRFRQNDETKTIE